MNVNDIVKEYLERHGYEGLFCEDCSCEIAELFPCYGNKFSGCEVGYKLPCPGMDDCNAGGGCRFHIGVKNE